MKQLDSKNIWDESIAKNGGDFLQSWQWGEFQKAIGQKVLRLNIDGLPVQMIKYQLPLGQSYLYCPHMRIKKQELRSKNKEWRMGNGEYLIGILKQMQAAVKKEATTFLRIDPLVIADSPEAAKWQSAFEAVGFRKAPQNYYFSAVSQSPYVALLDVSQPENDILKKTRYNTRRSIRLARQRGVIVKPSTDLTVFYRLLQQTAQRKGIKPHPYEHYFKLKEIFGEDVVLFSARLQCHSRAGGNLHSENNIRSMDSRLRGNDSKKSKNDNLLAGAMFLFFNQQATYLHAGSLLSRENCEAPYLVLWRAICEAKRRGCHTLDLGAVAPEDVKNHPWQSITTFKMGFRPKRLTYLGAYDWVNKKIWYWLYCWKKNLTV